MSIEIKSGVTIYDIDSKGTAKQKMAMLFDSDFNGFLNEEEISVFNSSKITYGNNNVTITTPDGKSRTLEDIYQSHSDEFYKSGSTKVAVVDWFSGGNDFHGRAVSNILKSENPDLSVTRFDYAPEYLKNPNSMQKLWIKFVTSDFGRKMCDNENTRKVIEAIDSKVMPKGDYTAFKGMADSLKEIKQQIKNGTDYKAVNLSSGFDMTYEDINKLIGNEIREEITPENIGKYKDQIRECLRKISTDNKDATVKEYGNINEAKLSDIFKVIDAIDDMEIPVYVAQAYKDKDTYTIQRFNLFSLASNAKTVESGTTNPDGSTNSPFASTNSLAIDENGKRRIAPSLHYCGQEENSGGIEAYSTSYATPMALARDLKEKSEKNK